MNIERTESTKTTAGDYVEVKTSSISDTVSLKLFRYLDSFRTDLSPSEARAVAAALLAAADELEPAEHPANPCVCHNCGDEHP